MTLSEKIERVFAHRALPSREEMHLLELLVSEGHRDAVMLDAERLPAFLSSKNFTTRSQHVIKRKPTAPNRPNLIRSSITTQIHGALGKSL